MSSRIRAGYIALWTVVVGAFIWNAARLALASPPPGGGGSELPTLVAWKFNDAATTNTNLLTDALAPDSRYPVTTYRATVSVVSTASILNLVTTAESTSLTEKLNGGTSLTAGVVYELKWDAYSGATYQLQCATTTTIGQLLIVEDRSGMGR